MTKELRRQARQAVERFVQEVLYAEGSLKDVRQFFLFVYFDADRYDGYLWFLSLPK